MKIGGQIPWNVTLICEKSQIYHLIGKTPQERRFGQPFEGPIIPFGSLVEYHPTTAKGPVKNPSIWKESLTWIVPRIRIVRGENLEGWAYWLQTLRSWRRWTHRTSTRKDSMRKR